MSVYGLLASLAWVAAAALLIERANAWAHRWLTLRERGRRGTEPVELPDDIVALAMQESDKWAQDDVLKVARERYDSLKDWNKVRAALGIGSIG